MTIGSFFRRVLVVVLVVLIVAGLWAARSTLMLGFAAAMLAVGISIPSSWLQQRGLPRGAAIACAVVGIGATVALLLLFVLPRLLQDLFALVSSLPEALEALSGVYQRARESSPLLQSAFPPENDAGVPAVGAAGDAPTPERAQALLRQFVEASLAVAPSLLGGVSTLIATLVHVGLVVFIALFFVIDPAAHLKGSFYLLPERYHERAVHLWNELYHTARTWLVALSFSIAITATLVWAILGLVLGMPNALVVAVFAGLATFIPNIGAFLPIFPIVVFALESDPSKVFLYVPVYLGIQLLESNVITPAIVKSELSIPAGALLLFQLLVTLAFGALGLLLAVPMLAMLMVLVRELYSYDTLGLCRTGVALSLGEGGRLALDEGRRPPSEETPPAEGAPVEKADAA